MLVGEAPLAAGTPGTVLIEFTPGGAKVEVRFANAAIRNRRRFTYEQVFALLMDENARSGQNRATFFMAQDSPC